MLSYENLNILHIAPALGGGVASVVEQLAREQVKLGANVTVVHPTAPDVRFNGTDLVVEECPARRLPGGNMLFGVPFWKAPALKACGGPEVVHFHGLAAQGCLGRNLAPSVCTLHGVSSLGELSAVRSLIVKAGFRRRSEFVAVDPATAAYFSGFAQNEIEVIPNGLPDLPDSAESMAGSVPVILFVGNLDELKGYKFALDAAAALAAKGIDFKMLFAGPAAEADLGYFERFRAENGLEGCVEYLGVVKDAGTSLVPASDLVLLPSRTEGFPVFLLEALRAGKPILATRVGGIPCLLKDGEDGLFVERDGRDIAEKASQLIADPSLRRSFSRRGRELFEAEYRIEGICKRYLAVYNRAVAAFGGRGQ